MKISKTIGAEAGLFEVLDDADVEDLQQLCLQLETQYPLLIHDKLEGPGGTVWTISINGHGFALVHHAYGIYLRAEDAISEHFMDGLIFEDRMRY